VNLNNPANFTGAVFDRPEFGTITGADPADPARIVRFGLKLYY